MTSFKKDILPLFRDVDIEHMKDYGLDLSSHDQVKDRSSDILARVSSTDDDFRMPPPPDPPWTQQKISLFQQWINENFPA